MGTLYEAHLEELHNNYINKVTELGLPLYICDMYMQYGMYNPSVEEEENDQLGNRDDNPLPF
jgi:hypothetical protein